MPLPEALNLGKAYQKYFEVVPAISESLRDEVYRIRHQVYCEDLSFEPERPDKRERDEYDAHSLHLLIRSVQTGEFVGCTRLVRVDPLSPDCPLPFEKACAESLDRAIIDPARLARDSIAEVSRLAVISRYRKRKGENSDPMPVSEGDFGTPSQPRFPYIPIALYLGTIELARLNHIQTLFVLTERRLASHFQRLGVNIQTIGGEVQHRGPRIPSMLNVHDIITNMKMLARPLYRVIVEEVSRAR